MISNPKHGVRTLWAWPSPAIGTEISRVLLDCSSTLWFVSIVEPASAAAGASAAVVAAAATATAKREFREVTNV